MVSDLRVDFFQLQDMILITLNKAFMICREKTGIGLILLRYRLYSMIKALNSTHIPLVCKRYAICFHIQVAKIQKMNSEHKKLAEKVIEFFKKSDKPSLSPFRDILHLLNDNDLAKKIITPLEKDFELIERSGKESYRLTAKGREFTTFDKLEKASKKTPLNTYQKIYLTFFILFGMLGIYKVLKPSVTISDFDQLKTDFHILTSRFDSIANSTKPRLDLLNDTLQSLNDLKDE